MIFSRVFWLDAFERAIRAGAWTLLGLLGADATVIDRTLSWSDRLTTTGYAVLLSLLASLSSNVISPASAKDSASLLPADVDPPQEDGQVGLDTVLVAVAAAIVVLALWGVLA